MISYDFIVDNFEVLEADFQREYGIDLRDAVWGENPIGVRRLSALIAGLSPGCATVRKLNTAGRQWGTTEELLATIAEQVDVTNRLLYQIHSKKGAQPWKPLEIRRPFREPVTISPKAAQVDFFASSEVGITVWDPGGADADVR